MMIIIRKTTGTRTAAKKASHERIVQATARATRLLIDTVFPFESTNEALAYVGGGRAKGKAVIKLH